MRPNIIAPIIVIVLTLVAARTAAAHAFLRRYDLPLPLWHYLAGAGLVVLFTFILLAIFRGDRAGRFLKGLDLSRTPVGRLLASPSMRQALSVLSVSLFVFLMAAGLFGAQDDPFANILPAFIWVGWWVGFAFLCALVGNPWPALNPWAAVARPIERALRRGPPQPAPTWFGTWPATLLYMGFAWAELAWPGNSVPASLATAILLYSAITWAGMARYGTDRWLRCGETFSIVFGLFGLFAPLARQGDGRMVLRPYGTGLIAREKISGSMVVFVVVLLASVSFDGFLHTPPWRKFFGTAFEASYDLGLITLMGNAGTQTLIVTAGLIAAPLVFLAVFIAICALTAALGAGSHAKRPHAFDVARLYTLTLVPIAIAYHLAHYLSLLLIEGQRLFALVSDPFGVGWNLFGTAGIEPDIAVVDARFLWLFSVVVIVAGHVIAVWLAHQTALRTCDDRKKALVSQIPMTVLMVAYTMLSLWILAQPIVEA